MWTETPQTAITAIHLSGGTEAIGSAKGRLEAAGFRLSPTGGYSLLLENVLADDLVEVDAIAAEHGLTVECLGEKEITIRKAAPKAFKLNLEAGKWYWADNLEDSTPLIFVKDVAATADAQVLTLEYLAPEGLPVPITIDSREVVEYGFRPATTEDFERYGLVAPDHTYLVPRMAKVEEVEPAKPKSASKENFKRRQEKVMKKRKTDLGSIEDLDKGMEGLRKDISDLVDLEKDLQEALNTGEDVEGILTEMELAAEDVGSHIWDVYRGMGMAPLD
jgi:hypothetical protein